MVAKITNAPTQNELIAKTNEIIDNIPDVSSKANIDLDNITSTGKTACAGFALPSSTYENLTLGSTGSDYTAPANGWFVLYKTAASSAQQISFEVQNNGIASKCIAGGNNQPLMIHVPVKKGDIMNVYYSASGTTGYFRFVYAKGEV